MLRGLRPVLGGLAVGFLAAALLGRALTALVGGLRLGDPLVYGCVAALLLAALDPSVTLRDS
jgi:hypothetical protein